MSLIGTGGGSGTSSANEGVRVDFGGQITAGGSGAVTVEGHGGNIAGTGGFSNVGVVVLGTGAVITSSGGMSR